MACRHHHGGPRCRSRWSYSWRCPRRRRRAQSIVAQSHSLVRCPHGVAGAVFEWWHSRHSDRVSRVVGDGISAAHIGRLWSHWISLKQRVSVCRQYRCLKTVHLVFWLLYRICSEGPGLQSALHRWLPTLLERTSAVGSAQLSQVVTGPGDSLHCTRASPRSLFHGCALRGNVTIDRRCTSRVLHTRPSDIRLSR